MSFTPSAVSAPGKVLLAGGYLVLDAEYTGLVFALSARIHSVSRAAPAAPANTITVRSPQFQDAEWTYTIAPDGTGVADGGAAVTQTAGGSKNPFVETAVLYTATYLLASTSIAELPGCTVTIYADNDYYSQRTPDAPRFAPLGVPISGAHKTGLGSSAALVTSLVACLLASYAPAAAPTAAQNTVHNLAQAAHCAAQGKVGSGFDVAAAVFGSCLYHRFRPGVLSAVGDPGSPGFAQRLCQAVGAQWDLKVQPVRLPAGLRLVMGDVDCGSSTPGMVRQVLAWRAAEGAAAQSRWDALEVLNVGLAKLLEEARADGGAVDGAAVRGQLSAIRAQIRAMGEQAGVHIEPGAQTQLLDAATEAVEGVLGGVVPGAGGWDAVCFVCEDREETVRALKEWLRGYKDFVGETGHKGRVTPLETREEMEGVRTEDLAQY
ncbi:ribosomal protein S5 domain 2-type protein [Geopyxis carbonaria]|nr:ribosomal protein S5 domain 2-type protein [Geopyxis carbonaria]